MSGKKLTASVAICTCNGEKYIADQIKSILKQSIKPDQIAVSDDCSTDNTIEIVKRVLSESGIDYVININNPRLGITKNFDKAFTLCKGDVIFPSDQDNVWEPEYIDTFVGFFQDNPNILLAYCNGYVTDSELNKLKVTYSDEQMNIYDKDLFLRNAVNKFFFPHGHTIAFRREFALKCIPSGFYYDEWLTMCAAAEKSIGTINKKLINFRRHTSAASAAEGGGEKKSKLKILRSKSFDEFFVWPGYQSKAYERYLQLYNKYLSDDIRFEISEHMAFEAEIDSLRELSLIKREKKLYRLFTKESYKKYRGNRNTYILDALYLLIKTRFSHST